MAYHKDLSGADLHPPKVHASSHTDGTDDIQSASSSQKGLMTTTHAAKLDAFTVNSGNVGIGVDPAGVLCSLYSATNFNLFTLKCGLGTGYTRLKYEGTASSWTVGVGNASAAIADLQNKFYVYDFTNADISFTITPSTQYADFYGQVNTKGVFSVDGAQVVSNRATGWTAPTGTAVRSTFATYAAPDISTTPTEAEVQALADHVQVLSQRLKALIDDLTTHGLIGA